MDSKHYPEHNRRKAKRLEVDIKVVYNVKKSLDASVNINRGESGARMLDISVGGLALITDYNIPTGSLLHIKFALSKIDKYAQQMYEPIDAEGQVRYNIMEREKHRLGISFVSIDPKAKAVITNFIESTLSTGPIV